MDKTPPMDNVAPSPPASKRRAIIKWSLKLIFGVGLLVFLIYRRKDNWGQLLDNFANIHLGIFLIGLIFYALTMVFYAASQKLSQRPQRMDFSTAALLKINFTVCFYNLFLPSGIAPAAVKWYKLSKPTGLRAQAAAFVAFNRLVHLITLLLVSVVGIICDAANVSTPVKVIAAGALLLLLAMQVVFIFERASRLFDPFVTSLENARFVPSFIGVKLRKTWESAKAFQMLHGKEIFGIYAFALLAQAAGVVGYYYSAMAVDVNISPFSIAWLRGVAILATLLPISISGLGVREVGLLAFMRKYATPEPRILAFSLLTFFVSVLRGIVGGLIEAIDLLREGIKKKREGLPGNGAHPPAEQRSYNSTN